MLLKDKFKNRDLAFGAWVSFSHPSITEIFSSRSFDFLAIDMEHTTISLEQAQRIIAASQSNQVPCLPRPVSHLNDWIKPLLDSGADGIISPLIEDENQATELIQLIKYPPLGRRSFGVNRAHEYGSKFSEYVETWNSKSIFMAQIESKMAVKNIEKILSVADLDAVMIGPYDLSGSLGVPGNTQHPLVLEAEKSVIAACVKARVSCGTQIANFNEENLNKALEKGYNFIIASSDLFVLNSWADSANNLIRNYYEKLSK